MTDAPAMRIAVMSMDEFLERSAQQGAFEFIDGEVVPKMPTVSLHGKMCKRLFLALLPFEQQGLGQVFQETTYVLTDTPDWVTGSRIPDVMFVSNPKLKAFEQSVPDADRKPYILVPDLVIEVVSPNDKYSDIDEKVTRYLEDGVRLVLVVDPQRQKVAVREAGKPTQLNLTEADTLTGGDVLPGFSIPVAQLFA